MKANSWTEFQPLKEVILGKAYSSEDITAEHFPDDELRSGLKKIFDETEEDVLKVKEFLESLGVNVRRPKVAFDLQQKKGYCNLQKFDLYAISDINENGITDLKIRFMPKFLILYVDSNEDGIDDYVGYDYDYDLKIDAYL